ncbi:hypothetical protein CYLTODRAFT_109445 [Cylindrobasidium torrendii FP15055 ss-10]|uniref:Uncharacterized protein n=1 Tax=Cylindrobasidium torrendii FP15055 ss-10 TaxID=1314674 RepID=A0A0D7B0R0_9AGAR|nr:hypothetical protein CYLTODRAFT_109445 [Cylindrobasidium torrendii FP15055 ss-10]
MLGPYHLRWKMRPADSLTSENVPEHVPLANLQTLIFFVIVVLLLSDLRGRTMLDDLDDNDFLPRRHLLFGFFSRLVCRKISSS